MLGMRFKHVPVEKETIFSQMHQPRVPLTNSAK